MCFKLILAVNTSYCNIWTTITTLKDICWNHSIFRWLNDHSLSTVCLLLEVSWCIWWFFSNWIQCFFHKYYAKLLFVIIYVCFVNWIKKKKICSLVLAFGLLIREVGSDDDIRVTDDQLCYIIQTHHVYLYVCGVQSVVNGERGVNTL